MMYDVDYEIYKYINKLADQYIEFDDLLKQNHLTIEEAKQKVKQFKEKFHSLLKKYYISSHNLVETCYDLMEHIKHQPDNPDLQYLYFCIMTDVGLLNKTLDERTEEQEIRNYLRQNKLVQELTEFLKSQSESAVKYQRLLEYLKKPIKIKNAECEEETDFLYHLTIQHTFLHDSIKNEVYKDNLKSLLIHINSDETLKSIKPYIIFAVLARKTGMMQKRTHFMPNLKAVFQYQEYNILKDNGKNFNQYQSELELYDHLRRAYLEDADVDFCDYCFANLSPLSEWYYLYCEPNEEIPMTLGRKIYLSKPLCFPRLLSFEDSEQLNDIEFQMYDDAAEKLENQMLDIVEYLIQLVKIKQFRNLKIFSELFYIYFFRYFC